MSKYLCEECKFNNNGWCKIKKTNGLKQKNIQECDSYKKTGTTLILERGIHDYYGTEMMAIKINDEVFEVPVYVVENFIKNDKNKSIEVNMPD
jgi:hypothetical protein